MTVWEAVLLGIIQGLTEFLPISSTAHLVVARQLLGHANPRDAFTTAIQLGTLVAVVLYFRRDMVTLLRAFLGDVRARRIGTTPEALLGWKIGLGTAPVVVCGFAFKGFIKEYLYTLPVIATAALVFALLLWIAEVRSRRRPPTVASETAVGWGAAWWVGVCQALALIPGASRSGVTITAGLWAGLPRATAARFSFLLSLPSILGAGLYELYKDGRALTAEPEQTWNLVIGAAVAGIVGYASIAWLLGYLAKYSTYLFIGYRLVLGATIIALLVAGVIRAEPLP